MQNRLQVPTKVATANASALGSTAIMMASSSSRSSSAAPSEIPAVLPRPASLATHSDSKSSHSTMLYSRLLPPSALFGSPSPYGNHVKVAAAPLPRRQDDIPIRPHIDAQPRLPSPLMAFLSDSTFDDGNDFEAMVVDSDDDIDDEDESHGSGPLPLCTFILRTVRPERQGLPTSSQFVNGSTPPNAPPPNQKQLLPVISTSPPFVGLAGLPPATVSPTASSDRLTTTKQCTDSSEAANMLPPAISRTRSFPSTSSSLFMPYLQPISHMYTQGHDPSAADMYTSIYQLPPSIPTTNLNSNYTPAPTSPPPPLPSAQPAPCPPDLPPFSDNPYTHSVSLPGTTPPDRSATVMRRWSELECATLERAMITFGRNWKLIDRMHGKNGLVDQLLARFTPSHLASKSSYEVCRKRQVLKMTDEQIGIMATAFKGRNLSKEQEQKIVSQYIRDIAEERRQATQRLKVEEFGAKHKRLTEGENASAEDASQ